MPLAHKAPVIHFGDPKREKKTDVQGVEQQAGVSEAQGPGLLQTQGGEEISVVVVREFGLDLREAAFGLGVPAKHRGELSEGRQGLQLEAQPPGEEDQVRLKLPAELQELAVGVLFWGQGGILEKIEAVGRVRQ